MDAVTVKHTNKPTIIIDFLLYIVAPILLMM